VKVLTRRELFKEVVSKDTLKQVVTAWYGFTEPLKGGAEKKQESLLEKVNRLNSKHMKKERKEG
jgi:hypothetical protein